MHITHAGAPLRPNSAASLDGQLDPEGVSYELFCREPLGSAHELEDSAKLAVEICIRWGTQTLAVRHLSSPVSFALVATSGNAKSAGASYTLPEELLGVSRVELIRESQEGPVLCIPERASVEFLSAKLAEMDLSVGEVPLSLQDSVRLRFGALVVECTAVSAGRKLPRASWLSSDRGSLGYLAACVLGSGALLGAAAYMMPPMSLTSAEGIDSAQAVLIQQYMDAAAERERAVQEAPDLASDSSSAAAGEQAQAEEGSMGKQEAVQKNRRYAVKGPAANPDPHLAKKELLANIDEFGMLGLLNSGAISDPDAPTAPWGRDSSLGSDSLSALGNMWGDAIGESSGSGGLGLLGAGQGGGGPGVGIGLAGIGTLGNGRGRAGTGGFGIGHGRVGGSHPARAPRLRAASVQTSGRLPPAVIQRIVRQNYGRFRLCYEKGLAGNPNLQGRVTARFVIGRSGAVSSVSNGGSSMPDSSVVNCVVRAFYGLSFPKPEDGIVTVAYPIAFSPG